MRIFYLIAAVLSSTAIVILLGLTPERISADIMSFMHRDRSLKYKVDLAQGKVRKSRMQKLLDNIVHAAY